MFDTDDTIVAVSTAAGSAGRAIVRLSGPQAIALAGSTFIPRRGELAALGGFRTIEGLIRLGGAGVDLPARVYVFRAPRSYTRQDVVELHIPGPASAASAVTSELIDCGARQARAGEFTARAFFSGRLDLSAAQAVADVIDADSDAQLRQAAAALGGRIAKLCRQAADRLADVLAAVEAAIDLGDQDIRPDRPEALADRLTRLSGRLGGLADQGADVPDSAARPHVVLTGRPNVGKSSLLNALSGTDRAIVSALASTTRDVLGAAVELTGSCDSAVVLQDAAGFTAAGDCLAAAADNAARRAVARADVVLLVADVTARAVDADLAVLEKIRATNARAPLIVLANKTDAQEEPTTERGIDELRAATGLAVLGTSAVTGCGLVELRARLVDLLHLQAARGGSALALHRRQRRCLLAAAGAAGRAAELLAGAAEVLDVAELAAVELTAALAELGQISGQIVTEDILGRIFARFCVGK